MITTKFGNQYTEHEWAEMMTNWNREVAQAHDMMAKEEALISQGKTMLIPVVGEEKAYTVSYHLFHGDREIRFTSEEKQVAAEAIEKWMDAEARKLGLGW